jgi:hypothetical protein
MNQDRGVDGNKRQLPAVVIRTRPRDAVKEILVDPRRRVLQHATRGRRATSRSSSRRTSRRRGGRGRRPSAPGAGWTTPLPRRRRGSGAERQGRGRRTVIGLRWANAPTSPKAAHRVIRPRRTRGFWTPLGGNPKEPEGRMPRDRIAASARLLGSAGREPKRARKPRVARQDRDGRAAA